MIRVSIKINRSVSQVWDYFINEKNWEKWYEGSIKSVAPGWQTGASVNWGIGVPSRLGEVIAQSKIVMLGMWMDDTYLFKPIENDATILEIVESDPKGGARYTDGGLKQRQELEQSLYRLKGVIEREIPITSVNVSRFVEATGRNLNEARKNARSKMPDGFRISKEEYINIPERKGFLGIGKCDPKVKLKVEITEDIDDPIRDVCSVCGKTRRQEIINIKEVKRQGILVIGGDLIGYCRECNKSFCIRHCHDNGWTGVCPDCKGTLEWSQYEEK